LRHYLKQIFGVFGMYSINAAVSAVPHISTLEDARVEPRAAETFL